MFKRSVMFLILIGLLIVISNVQAQNLALYLISVASDGTQGTRNSGISSDDAVAISPEGRYIAFTSHSNNLVPGDTNHYEDVFFHDRMTGLTERVSVSSSGQEGGNLPAFEHDEIMIEVSNDGRYVVFATELNGLVEGDNDSLADIFLRDRLNNTTTLMSVNSNGEKGNGMSLKPCISADARFIGFHSTATNLVDDDTNGVQDVFVHDRVTGETNRISVNAAGQEGNGHSEFCSMSGDGNLIAYHSRSTNLDGIITNTTVAQTYLHNRQTGETKLISVSPTGDTANDGAYEPVMAANGRYIAFLSSSTNLTQGGGNGQFGVYVRDLVTAETRQVTVNSNEEQANGASIQIDISANGRFIVYTSIASNLVLNDTNNQADVFIHDLQTGKTWRVSVGANSEQGNRDSSMPVISNDGHWVAFGSGASNFINPDTNGDQYDIFEAELPFYDTTSPSEATPDRNYFTSLPITLTWTKLKQAASYEVQVSASPIFATLEASQSVTANQPRATFDGLANGIHYWRVRGISSIGVPGAWSTVDTFEINTLP